MELSVPSDPFPCLECFVRLLRGFPWKDGPSVIPPTHDLKLNLLYFLFFLDTSPLSLPPPNPRRQLSFYLYPEEHSQIYTCGQTDRKKEREREREREDGQLELHGGDGGGGGVGERRAAFPADAQAPGKRVQEEGRAGVGRQGEVQDGDQEEGQVRRRCGPAGLR